MPGWPALLWPVAMVGWGTLVFFVLGRLGLGGLAKVYPGSKRPSDGRTFRWRSGRIGAWMNYNNCLNVTVARAGIYVVPALLFRWFQPPVLLPWSGVKSVEEKRVLFSRFTSVQFADAAGWRVALFLPDEALADIEAFRGRSDLSSGVTR